MRSKCIRLLTLCITCLLCSSLFLESANAINLTLDVIPTGYVVNMPSVSCYRTSWAQSSNTACPGGTSSTRSIGAIRTNNTYSITEGNYYQVQLQLRHTGSSVGIPNPVFWSITTSDDFEVVTQEKTLDEVGYVFQSSVSTDWYLVDNAYNTLLEVTLRAKRTADNVRFQVGTENGALIASDGDWTYQLLMRRVVEFEIAPSAGQELEKQNEKDEEDRSNIESQSSDTDASAGDSQSDAEDTGTTLLGAFSGFVSALTNATPSTCILDMDLGNLDMGNVDFCQLNPPAGFQALASIFLILFCVPLSIATARKVISLFRSFQ